MAASGSHAFMALVDTAIELHRWKRKNQRALTGEGRIEPVTSLVYEMDEETGLFLVKGTLDSMQGGKLADKLLAVLTKDWQTTKEIADQLDPAPKDASKGLRILARQGEAERNPPMEEGSSQGKVYQWRKL